MSLIGEAVGYDGGPEGYAQKRGDPGAGNVGDAVRRVAALGFWPAKRCFDVVAAILGLPFLLIVSAFLLVANPFWNPGSLLYRQRRMGRDGLPITVWKFRTMLAAGEGERGPEDPLEVHRVTPLGAWLRRTRIDETMQFLNVLKGEMSLIGPRPDLLDHATAYVERVPGYRERLVVRPGITGLAQVRMGYAEGFELTERKVHYDLAYIRKAGWAMDARVLRRTLHVLATGFGAR